jgi:hypothetical protein
LYELVETYMASSVETRYNDADVSEACWVHFEGAGDYLVPWSKGSDSASIVAEGDSKTFPSYCGVETVTAITSYGDN